jgi:hypothetical protein
METKADAGRTSGHDPQKLDLIVWYSWIVVLLTTMVYFVFG